MGGITTMVGVAIVLCFMVTMVQAEPAGFLYEPYYEFPDPAAPLDKTTTLEVAQLEALFPKFAITTTTTTITNVTYIEYFNATTNETTITNVTTITNGNTTIKYATKPTYWCDDKVVRTANNDLLLGNNGIYSIRTGYPPVCVMWWGQLRNNITSNKTDGKVLFDPVDYPGFRLWKQIFYPQVDTFSLLEVLHSNYYFTTTHVAIQIPGFQRSPFAELQRINDTIIADGVTTHYNYVVPFMTAIIELEGGTPTNITWDQGCDTCGNDPANGCINYQIMYNDTSTWTGNCGSLSQQTDLTPAYGFPYPDTPDTSGLKIYLGWFGTDAHSKYCTSADKRFSQFRKYSLHSAFESAANAVSNQSPSFNVDFSGYGSGSN